MQPMYRSSLSSEPIKLREARIAVVSPDDLPPRSPFRGSVRFADLSRESELAAIKALNMLFWGELEQSAFGRTYDVLKCENMLAIPLPDEPEATNDRLMGIAGNVALKSEDEGFLHIVVFQVWPEWHGRGVGRRLLDKAIVQARLRGHPCIKLETTNDNIPAIYFYQRVGFVIDEVIAAGFAEEHEVEAGGFAGIPVRDEIRFRLDLKER